MVAMRSSLNGSQKRQNRQPAGRYASRAVVPFEGASSAFDIPGLGPGEPSVRGGRACGPGLAPGSGRPRPNRKRYNMQEMNSELPGAGRPGRARAAPPTAHQPSGDGTIS